MTPTDLPPDTTPAALTSQQVIDKMTELMQEQPDGRYLSAPETWNELLAWLRALAALPPPAPQKADVIPPAVLLALAKHYADTDCDSDISRTCIDNWPSSVESWCAGCHNHAIRYAVTAALAAPQAPALDHEALLRKLLVIESGAAIMGETTWHLHGRDIVRLSREVYTALRAAPRAPAAPQEAEGCEGCGKAVTVRRFQYHESGCSKQQYAKPRPIVCLCNYNTGEHDDDCPLAATPSSTSGAPR